MNLLDILSSVGVAYSKAAASLIRHYIRDQRQIKMNVLHALIGVAVGVGSTFLVGFLYYLFGSTNETCQGAAAVCVARRDWAIAPAFFTFQFNIIISIHVFICLMIIMHPMNVIIIGCVTKLFIII